MEQLKLRIIGYNNCNKETKIMSDSSSILTEHQKNLASLRARNRRIKELVDDFFLSLPESRRFQKNRWSMAADFLNEHPEGLVDRDNPWNPQGLARVCQLVILWQKREASPEMVTPERRKIFQLISQLLQEGHQWVTIAETLNVQGYLWRPKGRAARPFTHKIANDFYRHHQHLWPIRPRRGSRVQQEILRVAARVEAPPTQNKSQGVDEDIHILANEPVIDSLLSQHKDQCKVHKAPAILAPPVAKQKVKAKVTGTADGETTVFKKRYGTNLIEVSISVDQGAVNASVLYCCENVNSASAQKVLDLLHQLNSIDYTT